ncbi:IFRD1 regulator, partial [Atractosteus spatula]|nr:IFRD1 regulator [Atractosteus spatula]
MPRNKRGKRPAVSRGKCGGESGGGGGGGELGVRTRRAEVVVSRTTADPPGRSVRVACCIVAGWSAAGVACSAKASWPGDPAAGGHRVAIVSLRSEGACVRASEPAGSGSREVPGYGAALCWGVLESSGLLLFSRPPAAPRVRGPAPVPGAVLNGPSCNLQLEDGSELVSRYDGARNGGRVESGASDDDMASEVLSHCSSASESASVLEEGTVSEPVDEQAAQEETEDKLKQCIDDLMDKSAERKALGSARVQEVATQVSYSCPLSPPAGSGEEQAAAATVCALLCVQLGGGSKGEEGFATLCPALSTVLSDDCASTTARQSCAVALGMCCYVSAADNMEDLWKSLSHLESVFSNSYPGRDGALPSHKPGTLGLHCAALQAWALLVTLCPASRLHALLELHLPKLQACLASNDVHFRIVAGETIALLFELGREIDEDFLYEDAAALCGQLKDLATDSHKHRAKSDRRKQRSIFREVLHYIESEDFTEEKIRFGVESLYIDCWMRRRTYDAFKEVLGSGVRHHLQWNQLLRDVFELGPVLVLDSSVKANRISRFEKHLFNAAAFKARTKQRNKVRDKRADVM